ncbi:MAG: FAD-binding protein [Gammaproteobacteria bacterium]|nr:FAD-binding protein [Gammaproteobacteria bacterium]
MEHIIPELRQIVGDNHILTNPVDTSSYLAESRHRYTSECLGVVLPENAIEVTKIVEICAKNEIGIVPQGGNTGTVGGAVAEPNQILLNLKRMNQILSVDPGSYTMTVQSGCILEAVKDEAKKHSRLFPLTLGAQGSCQIGGNIATNAGGVNVLHYGNTRDLVLGLEVVLASGQIWDGLSDLRKDNTGYDLKNLFIGSEGTLGVITAATLKLFPDPQGNAVFLIGLSSPTRALQLLDVLKIASGDRLTTFELMSNIAVQSAVQHIEYQSDPFKSQHPWYVLVIAQSSNSDPNMKDQIMDTLSLQLENQIIDDVLIAQNQTQADAFAQLRENVVIAQKSLGASIKHDVSVPISGIPGFLELAFQRVVSRFPGARPYAFGHMGDGNIHFNVSQPKHENPANFLAKWEIMNELVYDLVSDLKGSFSAEHGVGISKINKMEKYKDPVELELLRNIKNTLDPQNLFNRGKIIREGSWKNCRENCREN